MTKRDKKGRFLKGNKLTQKSNLKKIESIKLSYQNGERIPIKYWLGKKLTEEHKKKVSIGNKGKKRNKKQNKQSSIIMKKKWEDIDYRKNMSLKHSGKIQSIETIIKRVEKIKGELNWRWKGGITPLVRKIRNGWEMKKWKNKCKERSDNCLLCGSKKELVVDHIKAFSKIMSENNIKDYKQALKCKELWDINNGRIICKDCHLKTDNYGNKQI